MSFTNKISKNAKNFRGLPFWSWNDKLEKDELIRQIRNMKDINLNGFFMHARGGLVTEYCSDEWYECINACVEEAKQLGMEAWAYDENGWPSGFAGGRLLKDEKNFVPYLTCSNGAFDENAFAVYELNNGIPQRIQADNGRNDNLNIYRTYSSSYVDIMDADIVRKYIDATHEEYKTKVGDEFGKTMPGFFTDEPQYYRYNTAWSDSFLTIFQEKYGYSVFDVLPALFIDYEGAKELRYDYWLLCHTQYTNSFAKQIYDWCNANGAKLTGHSIEETSLNWQMICSGGVMPFYEFQHMPGIDHLTRRVGNDLSPKQIGSVAAQLGKTKVLSETFALCGWDVSPTELKRIAQWQFVSGVNVICAHLYPYSERGERKYDYPAHYSEHLPWNSYLKQFNTYFANVGAAMAQGKEKANVLVLHPIHSAYLYFKRDQWDTCIQHLDSALAQLIEKYGDNNVQYHLGDETIIARHGKIKDGKFIIGKCAYDYVVLPECETIDKKTAQLIKKFLNEGGKLVSEGSLPTRIDGRIKDLSWLKPNANFNDILNDREAYLTLNGEPISRLRLNIRATKDGNLYYVTNLTGNEYKNVKLTVKNISGLNQIHMLDLKEDAIKQQSEEGGISAMLDLSDSASYMLIESDAPLKYTSPSYTNKNIEITTDGFTLTKTPENYMVLDHAAISYNGTDYEPVRYVKHIHELLLKRHANGRVYLKFNFNAQYIPEDITLCVEPLKNVEISVNGVAVKQTDEWRIDRRFKLAHIASAAKKGLNEIVISFDYYQAPGVYNVLFNSVMESLRNCLTLDTDIEAIYLFGSFGVKNKKPYTNGNNGSKLNNGNFVLVRPKRTIDIADVVEGLYPFYTGALTVKKKITAEKGNYRIKLDGRFAICNIYVNNKKAKTLVFDRYADIQLNEGENVIKLELINSLRNTFGPLHNSEDESFAVGPFSFTAEGSWTEDSVSPHYKERYSFMPFGVSAITLNKEK